jgi:hypothetical protein
MTTIERLRYLMQVDWETNGRDEDFLKNLIYQIQNDILPTEQPKTYGTVELQRRVKHVEVVAEQ